MDEKLIAPLIRILICLPLVAALAYFLIKHGLARQPMAAGKRRRMRLMEQIQLSPKATISLVEVGGNYILLAHSENAFHVLSEMKEPPEPLAEQDEMINLKAVYDNLKSAAGGNPLLGKLLSRRGKGK